MGACDFDDLLLLTVRALQDPEVRQRWTSRFDHILVDEFQDTNEPQLAIVRLLADRSQITAVGDAQQAIYGFRGAHAEAMDEFRRAFETAGTVVLGQNYRSTQPILDVCQAVIDENGPGAPRLWSDVSQGALPLVRECDDDRDEAAWICRLINQSAARGTVLDSIAILVRTNAMTRSIEEALTSNRIAYRFIGGARFYDRAEIRDAMAWLKLAANDLDAVSFERACTVPKRGVGPKTVQEVLTLARAENIGISDAAAKVAANTKRAAAGLPRTPSLQCTPLSKGVSEKHGRKGRMPRPVLRTSMLSCLLQLTHSLMTIRSTGSWNVPHWYRPRTTLAPASSS
jgi:DNA helicase-2/ATP-dependent DNA helicase PcrA